jgi:hypothetical protein
LEPPQDQDDLHYPHTFRFSINQNGSTAVSSQTIPAARSVPSQVPAWESSFQDELDQNGGLYGTMFESLGLQPDIGNIQDNILQCTQCGRTFQNQTVYELVHLSDAVSAILIK